MRVDIVCSDHASKALCFEVEPYRLGELYGVDKII